MKPAPDEPAPARTPPLPTPACQAASRPHADITSDCPRRISIVRLKYLKVMRNPCRKAVRKAAYHQSPSERHRYSTPLQLEGSEKKRRRRAAAPGGSAI